MPEARETLTLGLGRGGCHHTVAEAWIGPFAAAGRALAGADRPTPATGAAPSSQ